MGFGINMSKAKDIHKDNIREARKGKLAELDIEFQIAQEIVQIPLLLLQRNKH